MKKELLSLQLLDIIQNESPYGHKPLSGNQKIHYPEQTK